MLSFYLTNLIMPWSLGSLEGLALPAGRTSASLSGVGGSLPSASSLPLRPHLPPWMHWSTHSEVLTCQVLQACLCPYRLFPLGSLAPFPAFKNPCLSFTILLSKIPSAVKRPMTYLCCDRSCTCLCNNSWHTVLWLFVHMSVCLSLCFLCTPSMSRVFLYYWGLNFGRANEWMIEIGFYYDVSDHLITFVCFSSIVLILISPVYKKNVPWICHESYIKYFQ